MLERITRFYIWTFDIWLVFRFLTSLLWCSSACYRTNNRDDGKSPVTLTFICWEWMVEKMIFAVSLGATLVLEALVMIFLREHSKKNILLLLLVNLLTNPMAVYLAFVGEYLTDLPDVLIQLPIEVLVVLVEVGIYIWFSKDENWTIKKPVLLGILANMFSWSIGLMM